MKNAFRVLVTCLVSCSALLAQSIHNGDMTVLGRVDLSSAVYSKPFPTVTTDPTGSCPNNLAIVINTSTGAQQGHISGCVNGSWMLVGGATGVPSAGLVKSNGSSFLQAVAGIDYQSPLTFPLPLNQGGTGVQNPSLIGGAGIAVTGTWPNQTVTAVGGGGGGGSSNATFLQGNSLLAGTPTASGQTYLWNATNNDFEIGNVSSALSTSGYGQFVLSTGGLLTTPSFGTSGPTQTYVVGSAGVTANKLVSADTNGYAVTASAGGVSFGISTATASSGANAEIQVTGIGQCMMDGAATIGHIAIASSTQAGMCTDSGVTSSASIPSTTRIVGMLRTSTSSSGQLARIQIHGPGVFGTQSSGGGGGGATSLSGLTDYSEVSNPNGLTTLSFNNGISFGYNNQTCSFSTTPTISISGSASDTVYYYVTGNCQRAIAYNSGNTYTVTNMEDNSPNSGYSSFPSGSFPIASCAVVSGHFYGPCVPALQYLSKTNFLAGAGTTPTITSSGLQINVGYASEVISGTSYTVQATDQTNNLEFTSTSAVNVALPQAVAPGSGAFYNGWFAIFYNKATGGTNTVTITPQSSTINGAATLAIADGTAWLVMSEGTTSAANGTYVAYQIGGNSSGGGGGGAVTAPLALSDSLSASATNGTIDITNTSTAGMSDIWYHGGKVYRLGAGGSTAASPYTNAFFILDQTDSQVIATYNPTSQTWAFPGTESVTIGGNLTVSGSCSGCGSGGGGSSAFGALSSGTNTSAAMVVSSGASLSPGGSGTITATNALVPTAPYVCNYAGSTCYDAQDSWSTVTKPATLSAWINATPSYTKATNGNYQLSINSGSAAAFSNLTASTSAEATFEYMPLSSSASAAAAGPYLHDSTNSKMYVCAEQQTNASPYPFNLAMIVYSYTGSGSASYSSTTLANVYNKYHAHLKAVVSGTTLSCQASADGGQSFYTYATATVGTIDKGGIYLMDAAVNLLSLNVQ